MSGVTNTCGLHVCLFLILVTQAASFLLDSNDEYQVWLTNGDQTKKLSSEPAIQRTSASSGYSVWVDRNKRRQTMDGFGAALTNSAAYVLYHSSKRHEMMQDLFGANGLHMSYIRLTLGCSDMQAVDPYTYDDVPVGSTDFGLHHFSINKDRDFIIPIIKEALSINPDLKIMGSPWTAPAWMKSTHNLFGGEIRNGTNYLNTYAQYFVKVIQAYQDEGITFDSLSVQNEPMLSTTDYPTMIMNAQTQREFIRDHLGPMFKINNIATKILIWDYNWSGSWYLDIILSDHDVRQYVSGVAWHGYDGRHDTPLVYHNKYPDIGQYFTEISGGGWENMNWAETLVWDTRLITIGQTKSFAKTVMFWNIALDEHHGPKVSGVGGCRDCRPVVTVRAHDYVKNVEYYAIGHMSKFVKPGAVRLEANYFNWDDLQCVAFQNTDGTTVIVVQNPNSHKSASFSLDIDAKHYAYNNLPPQSVVSFVK